jgi:PKD repeat protein
VSIEKNVKKSAKLGGINMHKIEEIIRSGLKLLILFTFFSLCAIELASLGSAATYYVATNGNDSYNGLYPSYMSGSNGPFRTLGKAATTVRAGDTVQMRGGTYVERVYWNTNGTASNRITIENYNNETVIIDGQYTLPGGSVYNALVLIEGDYITFRDITVKRSSGTLFAVSGNYCYIINVNGEGSRESGFASGGIGDIFDGCHMTDNGNGYGINGQTSYGSAIAAMDDSSNNIIRNCISHNNRGEGLGAYGRSGYTIIEDCIAYDNQAVQIYIGGTGGIARRNIVYASASTRAPGIMVGGESGDALAGMQIVNNLCFYNWLNLVTDSNVTKATDWIIAYNTFVNSHKTAQDIASGYNMGVYFRPQLVNFVNSVFKNNIIVEEPSNQVPINTTLTNSHVGFTFSNNCWNKTPTAAAMGPGDVIGDPLLAKSGPTGPGLLTPAYFKIFENSPAKDRAQVLSQVTEDFFRTPRGSAPDIGAHEFLYGTSQLMASATGSPTSGQAPLTVNFTGSASGGTSPYSYRWTFGDGGSSTAQNPSHTYSSAGSYAATLTVTDSASSTNSKSVTITVTNSTSQLVATASADPTSGLAPLNVNFTGSATGGTPTYSYSWNFGDGTSSSVQNPSHTYSAIGDYAVILTVTDSRSANANATLGISVGSVTAANLALAAETGAPALGQGGTTDPSPGNHSYSIGSTASVRAIPNTDYRFSKWTGDVTEGATFNLATTLTMDKSKSLSATFCTKCSDVNGDLKITPADAQLAFDIYLGKVANPTWCELENADVNCSGTKSTPKVTPADAQTIFHKYLRRKGVVSSDCSGNSRQAVLTSMQNLSIPTVNLTVNSTPFNPGEDIYIPIIVESPSEIKAFGFDLTFPSDQLTYIGFEGTEITSDFDQLDANVISYPMSPKEGNSAKTPEDHIPVRSSIFSSKILIDFDAERNPAGGFNRQPAGMIEKTILRVGGYKTKTTVNPTSGVLITLVFRPIGEVKDTSSISIAATYDDIQNASISEGTASHKSAAIERPDRQSAAREKRFSGKRYDF